MSFPLQHNLSYYRGRTDVASIVWQDSNGAAVNLAGYAIAVNVRNAAGTVIASTSSGITATVTAATGTIVLTMSDAVGQALAEGTHRWDVWAVSSGGIDYPLIYGDFVVIKDQRNA